MRQFTRDVWTWLCCFPAPWRRVRVHGDVISEGGMITVGDGVTLEVIGNVVCKAGMNPYLVQTY